MAKFYYDPTSVNADDPRGAQAAQMRVGRSGELIFEIEDGEDSWGDPKLVPNLIIAPGEWKAAWSNE